MTELRKDLPELPKRMRGLKLDNRGYPVPFFVEWIDGEPDFRIASATSHRACVKHNLCWLCGQPLGRYMAFVIGPMCAINRVSSEPPSHRDCAEFAARACPFLARPKAQRRDANLPDEIVDAPGISILRNPGVALVWITRSYQRFNAGNGMLYEIGEPVETLWFAEGRKATRAEVLASIESGLPILEGQARDQNEAAVAELNRMTEAAMTLVPA